MLSIVGGSGATGAVILLASDTLAAYSAALIGLDSSEALGVVLLWFASSVVSATGCMCLGLCYFEFPCGRRLRLYFELACLALFSYSAVIEIAFGFCPVEKSSPNFFGSAGVMNLLGYLICLGALMSEDWPQDSLRCAMRFPPEPVKSERDSDEESKRLVSFHSQ